MTDNPPTQSLPRCPFCNIEIDSLAIHIAYATDDRHHRNNLALEIENLLKAAAGGDNKITFDKDKTIEFLRDGLNNAIKEIERLRNETIPKERIEGIIKGLEEPKGETKHYHTVFAIKELRGLLEK